MAGTRVTRDFFLASGKTAGSMNGRGNWDTRYTLLRATVSALPVPPHVRGEGTEVVAERNWTVGLERCRFGKWERLGVVIPELAPAPLNNASR